MSACAWFSLINPNQSCQCFYQPHISGESFQQRSRDQDSQKAISCLWFWTHCSSRNMGASCGIIIRIHYHSYIHNMVTSNNVPAQLEKSFHPLKTWNIRFTNYKFIFILTNLTASTLFQHLLTSINDHLHSSLGSVPKLFAVERTQWKHLLVAYNSLPSFQREDILVIHDQSHSYASPYSRWQG